MERAPLAGDIMATDERLLRQRMTITSDEIAQLVAQHGAALELFAAQWTRFPADAVQEAFIAFAGQRLVPPNPRAWLYQAVRFRAKDAVRSETRRRVYETDVARDANEWFEPNPGDALVIDETVTALRQLPLEQRETIVARLWGGMSFREIAELTESSTATCHRRYSEGIAALRNKLEPSCQTNSANLNNSLHD